MEYHCGKVSIIFCSKFMTEDWNGRLERGDIDGSVFDHILLYRVTETFLCRQQREN